MSTNGDLTRPWGQRLRTWREEIKGWSREECAEHVAAAAFATKEHRGHNIDAGMIRKWERGKVLRPQNVYRRVLAHMGAPLPLAPPRSDPVLPSSAPADDRDDEGVERREFLQASTTAAAAAGLAQLDLEPWQRLATILDGGYRIDTETLDTVETATQALFDAEEHEPSPAVAGRAHQHLSTISDLISAGGDETRKTRLLTQAGTSAALAGWLAYDQDQLDSAANYYTVAARAAEQADDPVLLACVHTYRSYLAHTQGRGREAVEWLTHALAALPRGQQPTMHAWIRARQAETALALGEHQDALRAFDRAFAVHDFAAHEIAPPAWTRFFTPTRLDGMAAAGYAQLNHDELETVAARLLDGIGTGDTKVQQIALADLAYSYFERGDAERGAELGQQAFAAIHRSGTRVGYDRLALVGRALAPYRGSRSVADLQQQLDAIHQA